MTLDDANWPSLPFHLHGGMRRYLEQGIEPGDFLCAVLRNDLRGAVLLADDINAVRLADIVRFLYNGTPSGSWGSPAAFDAWIEKGGLVGKKTEAA